MNDYEVTISLECTFIISAINEEVAKDIAYEWFTDAEPNFEVREVTE